MARVGLDCSCPSSKSCELRPQAAQFLLFLYRTKVHVELQFYQRSWIKAAIQELHPLAPEQICPRSPPGYNLTLANAPKAVKLSPGIALRQDDDCFNFASTLPSNVQPGQTLPEQVIYHTYWRADLRALQERQVHFLSSLLATQSIQHSSVVLWTNHPAKLQSNPLLAPLLAESRFAVQHVDLDALARDTPLAGSPVLAMATDKKAWLDGDLVRLLLLYRHGGVWVDMDYLILRDFRPLLEQEWLVQWDCYDKPYTPLNGAVMHFHKASPFLCEMLYAMTVEPPPRKASTDWGSLLYYKVWRRLLANGRQPFQVLPWCLMDPRNCKLDNRIPDPFERDQPMHSTRAAALDKKLSSIYALHLHNQWGRAFPAGGWVERLVLPKISGRAPN